LNRVKKIGVVKEFLLKEGFLLFLTIKIQRIRKTWSTTKKKGIRIFWREKRAFVVKKGSYTAFDTTSDTIKIQRI